jgi:extracellular elastinolytic metalloproteinase
MGWYSLNQPSNGTGIRRYKYSTNLKTSPHLYSQAYIDVTTGFSPHPGGEVWASFLNEMYWNLVDLLGYDCDWYNAKLLKGNIVALNLIIGGMKRQPCNPNFLQARDAIIQAGTELYLGKYNCQIWQAFAKRGLGLNALSIEKAFLMNKPAVNSHAVPKNCK